MNIIYHYYPRFRKEIFENIAAREPKTNFIYGRNARFAIESVADERHHLQRNFYFKNLIVQSFGLKTLKYILSNDSVILGDLKFLNTWLYALLGRLFGRRILFWTHGVLEPETGVKWILRKAYYSLAHGLLLYSKHEADILRNLGFKKPIFVIGNANYSSAELDSKSNLSPASPRGLCYIGRISNDKGFSDFVRLALEYPDRKVLLIGPSLLNQSDKVKVPKNLTIVAPEYERNSLRDLTADCSTMIMFTPAGLSLFTAALLGKRIVIKHVFPQKPEFHLLQAFGLIELFTSYEELQDRIENPSVGDEQYHSARLKFLKENSAEEVALRLLNAYTQIQGNI